MRKSQSCIVKGEVIIENFGCALLQNPTITSVSVLYPLVENMVYLVLYGFITLNHLLYARLYLQMDI